MKLIYPILPDGRFKALTLSFDDGRVQDRRLVTLLNRCGIKATFNLNSGEQGENRIPLCEYAALYAGHEIAAHGVRHPGMTAAPLPLAAQQVLEDRRALEHHTQAPVRGFAYPYGEVNAAVAAMLPALGIRYARVVGDTHDFAMPHDFMTWKATCHHKHNLLEDGKRFVELYKTQYLYMMYVWGHSFEFRTEEDWALMEQFCQLAGGREDTWYATNIEIVDYMADAARLQYTAAGDKVCNPNAQSIWVEVDGRHYEIPAGKTVALV